MIADQDRRSGLTGRRTDDQEDCPLTPECVRRLISRLESVEEKVKNLPDMQTKVNDLHEKFIRAGGMLDGMKIGVVMTVLGLGTFVTIIFGLLSGKISIKDVFSGFF